MIEIRTLQANELYIWRTLRLKALANTPDAFGDTLDQAKQRTDKEWRESLLQNEGKLFIAEYSGTPVGMARVSRSPNNPSASGLYSMWVDPSARAKGVGKALMEAALSWAEEAGVDEMALFVTQGNERAKRLYLAAGFLETGALRPLRSNCDRQMEEMTKHISQRAG